ERIDPGRPLADYGFDSLSGMKIVAAVDEEFGSGGRLIGAGERGDGGSPARTQLRVGESATDDNAAGGGGRPLWGSVPHPASPP
ncbi:acyl carrier protein, partial [Streptomyces sp. NPDC002143]